MDLNPIRAKLAETPETSDYTSIQERISPQFDLNAALQEQTQQGQLLNFPVTLKLLLRFSGTAEDKDGIPFSFIDYLALVDWTGRAIREDKRGFIDHALPPILERLKIKPAQWLVNTTHFEAVHRKKFSRQKKSASFADTG